MSVVGQEFWIVATGCSENEKDALLAELKKNQVLSKGNDNPQKFSVPDGDRALSFGSFDNLIRLTDELQKHDSQVDGIVHRLERLYVEADPKANFIVKSQRQEKQVADYLRNWQWDEARYPRTRPITDNITLLMASVNRLDDEARSKTALYNDFKTQKGNMMKKEGANLTNRDLIDVLTPDVVRNHGTAEDDFVTTEHLTTIPVILTRGADADFLKNYESMAENVVPQSARKFEGLDDKDGNSVWRVVVFKKSAEALKKACREKRYIVRDFEYSEEAYKKLKAHREEVEVSVKRQHELVKTLYQAAWSDCFVAWMHIKAMRVFVESVLRFGMPPKFASFILSPKAVVPARKALADLLGKSTTAESAKKYAAAAQEDGEEYYPYVSFSFTPFNMARDKA